MKCSVLSSGSKANCTYIETKDLKVLIDCGLSCRQCEKSLSLIGVDPDSIDVILVTHAHIDHIKGVSLFSNKHHASVWCTRSTLSFLKEPYDATIIEEGEIYNFKKTKILTASAFHDVPSCVSYKIVEGKFSFAYLTDTGMVDDTLEEFLSGVNGLILEFNHDPIMLQISDYNWNLKKRIASNRGHLSNKQACEVLKKIYHKNLKALFLAHLSENTNTPEIALNEALNTMRKLGNFYVEVLGYSPTLLHDLSKDLQDLTKENKIKFEECIEMAM